MPRHTRGATRLQVPRRENGRPEELVAAVRYLCSDDARYMTGTMLVLDGGYTAQ